MKHRANSNVFLIALAGMAPLAAMAAGAYDGKWSAQQNMGGSCGMVYATLTVQDNKLSGTVTTAFNNTGIRNVDIAPDGSATFNGNSGRSGLQPGTVKFSSSGFELHFSSTCGDVVISGKKAT